MKLYKVTFFDDSTKYFAESSIENLIKEVGEVKRIELVQKSLPIGGNHGNC